MGSWAELDARYEPGKLTPATAFIVAIGHMAGAQSVYADKDRRMPAAYLPDNGLGNVRYDDLLERAERYLQDVPLDRFFSEAAPLLTDRQKMCILVNMLDTGFAHGLEAPEAHPLFKQFHAAFAISDEQLDSYIQGLRVKNNLAIFPQ